MSSDDIVTRLRKWSIDLYPAPYGACMEQAAEEIQRLNKLVTTWIICAERLVESNEGDAYEKALEFYLDCQRIAKETC